MSVHFTRIPFSPVAQEHTPAFSPMNQPSLPSDSRPSYSPTVFYSPVNTESVDLLSERMDNLVRGGPPLRFGASSPYIGSPVPEYVSYPPIYGLRWGSPSPEQARPLPVEDGTDAEPSSPSPIAVAVRQSRPRSCKLLRSYRVAPVQQPRFSAKRIRYPTSDSASEDSSADSSFVDKRTTGKRKPKGTKLRNIRRPSIEDLLCGEEMGFLLNPPRATA